MNKIETAAVAGNVGTAENAAQNALHVMKSKPRTGKDLERLKLLESIVQTFEAIRLLGSK